MKTAFDVADIVNANRNTRIDDMLFGKNNARIDDCFEGYSNLILYVSFLLLYSFSFGFFSILPV